MYATRLYQLLFVAASISAADAAIWDSHFARRLVARQSLSEASGDSTSAVVKAPSTSASPAPAVTTVTEKDDTPRSTVVVVTTKTQTASQAQSTKKADDPTTPVPSPSSKAAETSVKETSPAPSPTTAAVPTKSSENVQKTTLVTVSQESPVPETTVVIPQTTTIVQSDEVVSEPEQQQTTLTPVTSTFIAVVTRTNSDGALETMTTTTMTTSTPGLNGSSAGSSSGMSAKTRNTVIGVVVGIGGSIILGALGLVAWRIWGRKKHADEADGLMDYNSGYSAVEKAEPGSSIGNGPQRNPFQSTLENYHQPTPVNASSNF